MKTFKILFVMFVLLFVMEKTNGQMRNFQFFTKKECNYDTLLYLNKNYTNNGRYQKKELDFLFQDAAKEFPFKSFFIGTLGGDYIYFVFMVESVDEIKKALSENRELRGVNCYLLKDVNPRLNKEFYASLSKIGLNRLHKMDNRFVDLVKEWQIEYVNVEEATDRMKAGLN